MPKLDHRDHSSILYMCSVFQFSCEIAWNIQMDTMGHVNSMDPSHREINPIMTSRGVARVCGARGKKQNGAPYFSVYIFFAKRLTPLKN